MTVKEVINLFTYNTAFEIKGAYSGKVYHKSYVNSNKNLEKYVDREVTDNPIYTDMRMRGSDTNHWCISVIVIWMYDYDLCHENDMRGKADEL